MYPVLSTVLSISTISATLAECFKKRAKKAPLVLEQAKPEQPIDQPPESVSNTTVIYIESTKKPPLVHEQAKPEQPMDRKPESNVLPWPFHFGLVYNILTHFDRRELCHLCNVNRDHYTVIQSKFAITSPFLVFKEQRLNNSCWNWSSPSGESIEEMPFDVRGQLPVSKFVRFKSSELLLCNPIESHINILSISHVWENQKLILTCAPNFVWNEEWAYMAAKAKYLEIPYGHGSIAYLRQLTSGNCESLIFTHGDDTSFALPLDDISDFLYQSNCEVLTFR